MVKPATEEGRRNYSIADFGSRIEKLDDRSQKSDEGRQRLDVGSGKAESGKIRAQDIEHST